MREILFRGKGIHGGTWQYGDFLKDRDKRFVVSGFDINTYFSCEVDPKTVGQYTGLKDSKGKEIYEGDIVSFCDFASDRTGGHVGDNDVIGKVGFFEDGYVVYWKNNVIYSLYEAFINDEEFEVIGNIFDNRELLEELE